MMFFYILQRFKFFFYIANVRFSSIKHLLLTENVEVRMAHSVLFHIDNRFRVLCYKLVIHPYWCNFILVCIVVSSALLACEDPVKPQSTRNQVRP